MSLRNPTRLALGALLTAYVAPLGYIAIVSTPAYVQFPYFSVYIVPTVVAMLGLALLLSARAVRPMALMVAGVLGLWLAENVGSIFWRLMQWERWQGADLGDALLGALEQSGSRAPYWLAILAPLLAALACLRLTRTRAS
jgi:hypothetical protein